MWINNYSEQFQSSQSYESKELQVREIEQYEEISYQIQEAVISERKEIDSHEFEAQKEVYSELSGDDSNQNEASVELVFESKIEGTQNTDDHAKLASFDPIYIGVFALILVVVATSFLYYSIVVQKKTAVPALVLVNRGEVTSSYMNFGTTGSVYSECQESNFYQPRWKNNMSPTKTESSSSSHRSSSRYGRSTGDSLTHGSFTVEKEIINKKKSHTPEVIISRVRRSSRINNRSFSSP
uniref:uncharacterized protein LOC122598696 n=1 Tax=Erigeron canadensis TaxID=72917 RepID=UPI001CB89A68|nr:uncharacterized protein LOC122598696 [Erigeron canadensis]